MDVRFSVIRGSAVGVRVEVFTDQLDTALSNLLCVCPALSKLQNQRPPEVPSRSYNSVS